MNRRHGFDGAGVGAAMSVASTAIVGNAPVHRAGMAASMEEVSYEFGSLLAVAFLGSLLSAIYTFSIALPPGAPSGPRQHAARLLSCPHRLELAASPAPQAASQAFDRGYQTVMYVIAAVLAAGSINTGVLLRKYGPGSQSSTYPSH